MKRKKLNLIDKLILSVSDLSKTAITLIYLSGLCIVCYSHALSGTFVFDDRVAIVENDAVINYSTNFSAIFYNDFWGHPLSSKTSHKSYRPLITLLFHYEYIYGCTAYHMKSINLFYHILNTVLVWYVLKEIKIYERSNAQNLNAAFLAASIFAVHPVHTEAVSGIVSRADLMCGLTYLLALLVTAKYYRYDQISIVVLILTVIGILMKETAITIPLICLLMEYAQRHYFKLPFYQQYKQVVNRRCILYINFTIAILVLRLWWSNFDTPSFESVDNPGAHAAHLKTRLLTQHYIYAKNVHILLLPISLCFDWAFDCIRLVEHFTDYRLLSVIIMYAVFLWTVIHLRQRFETFFGMGLCIIPFLPASGIIAVGFVIAERVLYVPSIGFCYLVACGHVKLMNSIKWLLLKYLVQIIFAVTMIFLIMRCRQRAEEWLTEDSLFTSALDVCPNNAKVHYNIARLAVDRGNHTKAFYHYHKAIDLYPEYNAALMNLGNLYREVGDLKSAQNYLEEAVKVKPEFSTAWMNLGVVHATARQYQKAFLSYQKALSLRPNYAFCHYNMGNMFMEQRENEKALYHWKLAVALKPHFVKAWTNIITMLDSLSLFEEALQLSNQAMELHKDDTGIMLIRANVLGKLQVYEEAEALYLRIIAREPLNYLCHTNLGVLYHRWNNHPKAIQHYSLAVQANENKAITAKENLNKLKKKYIL